MKTGFPPVAGAHSKILILGSMPGEASLTAQQYYAFPRNAFWAVMGELVGVSLEATYQERLGELEAADIALWDVLQACEREGSLDSAINEQTVVANDFCTFLEQYPSIQRIYFNGKAAEKLFNRHVQNKQSIRANIEMHALPSTSPANARLSFESKLQAWRLILEN